MIRFKSFTQMAFFLIFSVWSIVAFIGGFYNSVHFVLCAMCAYMSKTILKHW